MYDTRVAWSELFKTDDCSAPDTMWPLRFQCITADPAMCCFLAGGWLYVLFGKTGSCNSFRTASTSFFGGPPSADIGRIMPFTSLSLSASTSDAFCSNALWIWHQSYQDALCESMGLEDPNRQETLPCVLNLSGNFQHYFSMASNYYWFQVTHFQEQSFGPLWHCQECHLQQTSNRPIHLKE